MLIKEFLSEIDSFSPIQKFGLVHSVKGLLVEVEAIGQHLSVGSIGLILTSPSPRKAEIVGFKGDLALMMVYGPVDGVSFGQKVYFFQNDTNVYPTMDWIGRIINYAGEPIDKLGPLPKGNTPYYVKSSPPAASERNRVGKKIDLGVRSMNTFLSCCSGQRMGIFAGSGVGKSVLLSMITRFTNLDVVVIGLIGERGREVQEFIQDDLGAEGLKKSIVVVATSSEPALVRRQAAYMTLTISEFLADQGMNVLCLMDSTTRFAMAQREIGLSVGEPPTAKGYPPSVFAELPRLLERAGPTLNSNNGSITGLFTVLVEGDDHNEPISDAVRGILDGHIMLDRSLAERGQFPAINILRSISRTMPSCNTDDENGIVLRARALMATYNDMAELIRLGAYKKGSDKKIDEAIFYNDRLVEFLKQGINESSTMENGYKMLREILDVENS